MSEQTKAWAGQRDASWWNRPDCYKPKRYHMLSDNREDPLCGQQMMINEDSLLPPEMVPPRSRCQRNGCRQAWPTITKETP